MTPQQEAELGLAMQALAVSEKHKRKLPATFGKPDLNAMTQRILDHLTEPMGATQIACDLDLTSSQVHNAMSRLQARNLVTVSGRRGSKVYERVE